MSRSLTAIAAIALSSAIAASASFAQVSDASRERAEAFRVERRAIDMSERSLSLTRDGHYEAALAAAAEARVLATAAFGEEHPSVLRALTAQAHALAGAERFDQAEPLFRDVVKQRRRLFGATSIHTLGARANLAEFYISVGRYDDALERLEGEGGVYHLAKLFHPNHPFTQRFGVQLLELYAELGRAEDAARLSADLDLSAAADQTWELLENQALVSVAAGAFDEAAERLSEALRAAESDAAGPRNIARLQINLAIMLRELRRFDDAEASIVLAEAALETFALDFPDRVVLAEQRGALAVATKDWASAQDAYERVVQARRSAGGSPHPYRVVAAYELAKVRVARAGGPPSPFAREAMLDALTATRDTLASRPADFAAAAMLTSPEAQALFSLAVLERLLAAGDVAANDAVAASAAFELSQAFAASEAAEALAASLPALSTDKPELRRALRERADVLAEQRLIEREALALFEPGRAFDADLERALYERHQRGDARLAALTRDIEALDPAFAALIAARVTKAAEVRSLLKPDEALVAYSAAAAIDKDVKSPLLLAFVVTTEAVSVRPLGMTRAELDAAVAKMRAGLDPTGARTLADLPDLDLAASQALYARVFEPLREDLGSARRVFVVADGALASLPLHALVIAPGVADPDDPYAIYRTTRWLGDDYAFATLPAVGSLAALRRAQASRATKPLFGLGDPVMPRAARDDVVQADAPLEDPFAYVGMGPGDVTALSALADLPQTAALLRRIAQSVGADEADLKLGPDAQEAVIRTLNADRSLANYQTLAFATHALVAGELADLGLSEPALVLSAPDGDASDPANDGLLRASEVVTLALDAEVVMLVACNTAAADGSPRAGALSGLAKAFFYAGARSLLVSHWPAEANAAEILAPALIDASAAGAPRAEALQAAMIAVRNDPERPHFAHPALWAPFVVVGEGG